MEIHVFILLTYTSTGIVFITREADLQVNELDYKIRDQQHTLLRLAAGFIMMTLWPVFLLKNALDTQRLPMAVKVKGFEP